MTKTAEEELWPMGRRWSLVFYWCLYAGFSVIILSNRNRVRAERNCNFKAVAASFCDSHSCALHLGNVMLFVSLQSLQCGCLSLRVSSTWSARTCSSNARSRGLLSQLLHGGWTVTLCRVSPTAASPSCCFTFWFLFSARPSKHSWGYYDDELGSEFWPSLVSL